MSGPYKHEAEFIRFFQIANGMGDDPNFRPYPYQVRLALDDQLPQLLDIPTGLGKTAAIVLAWLWRRRRADEATRNATPRRFVYCLPMRVLVEQTYREANRWLEALYSAGELNDEPIAVHLLMGGEEGADWALWPERDAILIGTQDMLLSRALNRGYAASRARWPMEFGLLNSDCLWIFDEIQLMGNGLATTAQLDAFRCGGNQSPGWGHYGACQNIWMSATMQPRWLATIDHPEPSETRLSLSAEEREPSDADPGKRLHAKKILRQANNRFEKKPTNLAREILKEHENATQDQATMTLVVVNQVDRAIALHEGLGKTRKKGQPFPQLILLHSRFRPYDRKQRVDDLLSPLPPEGRIVVSTQVVEAGVDISAKVLYTDLAPWASLVQRFGRCNRKGEFDDAQVFWIDLEEKESLPYDWNEVQHARAELVKIAESDSPNVAPAALPAVPIFYTPTHVIRRKDVLELFDTTPDLAGNDIDISRYIRETDDHDVQVFWRSIPKKSNPNASGETQSRREELCAVPVGKFREFLKGKNRPRAWRWDFLDGQWIAAQDSQVVPGQTYMIDSDSGGYTRETGWTGKTSITTPPVPGQGSDEPESNDAESLSQAPGVWQSIAEHTDEVCRELDSVLSGLGELATEMPVDCLRIAARWHDRGKAHSAFQALVKADALDGAPPSVREGLAAKAPRKAWRKDRVKRYSADDGRRRHFRHELASALAVLQAPENLVPAELRSLIAYLAVSHHGKVRSSIRSLPEEFRPPNERCLFARGVWDGDELPELQLDQAGKVTAPAVKLCLELMQLGVTSNGQPSWAERMLRLRDDTNLGPFRLAYLESLLRAADCRASAAAEKENPDV